MYRDVSYVYTSLKYTLFAILTLNSSKFPVSRKMEWSNFQHGRVEFVKFGMERLKHEQFARLSGRSDNS